MTNLVVPTSVTVEPFPALETSSVALDDEYTLPRDQRNRIKSMVSKDRKLFTSDIQQLTNRVSTGIDVIICARDVTRECDQSYDLKKRLEQRGHRVELWADRQYDLSSEKGYEKSYQPAYGNQAEVLLVRTALTVSSSKTRSERSSQKTGWYEPREWV